jgi:hypothetical protein
VPGGPRHIAAAPRFVRRLPRFRRARRLRGGSTATASPHPALHGSRQCGSGSAPPAAAAGVRRNSVQRRSLRARLALVTRPFLLLPPPGGVVDGVAADGYGRIIADAQGLSIGWVATVDRHAHPGVREEQDVADPRPRLGRQSIRFVMGIPFNRPGAARRLSAPATLRPAAPVRATGA